MGKADKVIRIILAAIGLLLFSTQIIYGVIGIVIFILSIIFIITAILGFCPLYILFGIKTNKE
ncbi:MAG TPA: DUF2892 domain-containing protein [Bacteroidales bacterium]|nr:DUF2892 domain-containing protein [Bacteroidales bacterium]HRS18390.1 DUF2892 domain-containing protein [Bacteroidales bacterium]